MYFNPASETSFANTVMALVHQEDMTQMLLGTLYQQKHLKQAVDMLSLSLRAPRQVGYYKANYAQQHNMSSLKDVFQRLCEAVAFLDETLSHKHPRELRHVFGWYQFVKAVRRFYNKQYAGGKVMPAEVRAVLAVCQISQQKVEAVIT